MTFRSWLFACLRAAVGLAMMALPCLAETKVTQEPEAYAFSTRVYRVIFPEFMPEMASPVEVGGTWKTAKVEAFLLRRDQLTKSWLAEQEIILPKGSLALYDPDSQILILRTAGMAHDLVAQLVEALAPLRPYRLTWKADLVEAPAFAVRKAMTASVGQPDHTTVYNQLIASGRKVNSLAGGAVDTEATRITQGPTSLELNPYSSPRFGSIDMVLGLTHHYAQPPSVAQGKADGSHAKLDTSLVLRSGSCRLIGAWTVEGNPESAGVMQTVFIHSAMVIELANENPNLEMWFKAHGEAVIRNPKQMQAIRGAVPLSKMKFRRYPVPRDFLTQTEPERAPQSQEPIAVSGSKPRKRTAQEVLAEAGIGFPPGATACFFSATSELLMRNTQDAFDSVDTWVCDLSCRPPPSLSFSLHIVQADAEWFGKLQDDARAEPGNEGAWKAIETSIAQGDAKVVHSLHMDGKSGVPASLENSISGSNHKGMRWQLEAVVRPDTQHVEVIERLEDNIMAKEESRSPLINHSITLAIGSTRLISVWRLSDGQTFQGAFLHAGAVKLTTEE